jgi:hypothetical protein
MSRDSAQHVTSTPQFEGFFARTADQLRQFVCGLHGHDALLHFERGRISLQCASCGHESPGWEVKGVVRHQTESAPRRMHLISEQRVA